VKNVVGLMLFVASGVGHTASAQHYLWLFYA